MTLGIAVLDINRDGRMDLVLMHSVNPSYRAFALQALIQQADGSFVGMTLGATLTGSASPTGSVTFKDSYAAPIAGCAHRPLSGATATCTTSTLAYGPHTISALYSIDAGNPAALSPGFAHVVNAGALGLANPVFIPPNVAAGSVFFVYPAIRNVGTLALALTGLSFTGPFSLSNNPCGPTLAAGAACTIEVRYAPTAVSAQIAGTMQVTHTGANSPFTVDFMGVTSALSQLILSASFNPPSVAAGSANSTLALTLGNPNGVPLTNVDIFFNLPFGMLTAAAPNLSSTCSAGTWGPASWLGGGPLGGRTAAEFSGGTVAANTTCVISIAVTDTGGAGTKTVSAFPFFSSEVASMFAPVSLNVTPIQASAASAAGMATR